MNKNVYLSYIGACALLSRLSSRYRLEKEDSDSVRQALDDCVAHSEGKLRFIASGKGFILDTTAELTKPTNWVIYHVETTKLLTDKVYKTKGSASTVLKKYVLKAHKRWSLRDRRDRRDIAEPHLTDYDVAPKDKFHANIEKTEVRHGVGPAHGKTFEVPVNSPWGSGPWSDAYWSG